MNLIQKGGFNPIKINERDRDYKFCSKLMRNEMYELFGALFIIY